MNQLRTASGRVATGVLLALMLGIGWPAHATSLWQSQGKSQPASLYTTNRVWQVGDLVTVIIVEEAKATQTVGTETSKKSGASLGIETPAGVLPQLNGAATGGISGGDSLKSSGKTVRGGSITARVTARVKEVQSNGNLLIEGRQSIVLNRETQEIIISGIIRPEDVAADNTILSGYIADAQIEYKGAGALGAKQQQGLLTRFFNWFF